MGEERHVSGGVFDHGTHEEDGPGTWEALALSQGLAFIPDSRDILRQNMVEYEVMVCRLDGDNRGLHMTPKAAVMALLECMPDELVREIQYSAE